MSKIRGQVGILRSDLLHCLLAEGEFVWLSVILFLGMWWKINEMLSKQRPILLSLFWRTTKKNWEPR